MLWNDDELVNSKTLEEVLQITIKMLKQLRSDGLSIHHVAGPITADGDHNIQHNLDKLLEWRRQLSATLGPRSFVFTSPVIFNEGLYIRLGTFEKEPLQREAEFQEFWDNLIESGLLDEIHFAPGWERSIGAKREHQTALKAKLKINYLKDIQS